MSKFAHITIAAALLLAGACTEVKNGWSVDGVIDGAPEGSRIALQIFENGRWLLVDSLTVDKDGAFGYQSEQAAAQPELMRLAYPGKGSVYFPVDSVDNIIISANDRNFAAARVEGTPAAVQINKVDSLVNSSISAVGAAATLHNEELRRELVNAITTDTTAIVAYYVVSKSVGGVLLFRPDDSFGNRVYGAAAQVFATHRPDDARGTLLLQAFFEGRRALGRAPEEQTIEVPEAGLIDIVRYDNTGRRQSLAELAAQGKVVLLSFTSYQLEGSPAYNNVLNNIYNEYKNRGLEIYQIAFDDSEADWKGAAVNLPWITVWNSPSDGMRDAANYNVSALPLTYIIDRQGNIVNRVDNPNELNRKVAAMF